MNNSYKEWLDKLKPYENEHWVCRKLVKRLESKMQNQQAKSRMKTGCEVIFK